LRSIVKSFIIDSTLAVFKSSVRHVLAESMLLLLERADIEPPSSLYCRDLALSICDRDEISCWELLRAEFKFWPCWEDRDRFEISGLMVERDEIWARKLDRADSNSDL